MRYDAILLPELVEQLDRLGRADIVVGIPSYNNARTIGHVVRAVSAGLAKYYPDRPCVIVNSDGGSTDGTRDLVLSTDMGEHRTMLLEQRTQPMHRLTTGYRGAAGKGSALRAIFAVAAQVGASACAVVDSDLRSISPEWMELLLEPVVRHGMDFVAPLYARHKYDGTITNSIAYPLTRALYGTRIRQPIGGDFAVSGDLVQRYLELDTFDELTARFGIDIWMTHSAINEGFAACQARLGAKIHDAKDPASDLGPMFRQVVGTLFTLAGHYADRWLKVRGSHPIPEYGFERVVAPEEISVNHAKLIDNFEAARLTHTDTWSEMLAGEQLERLMGIECDVPATFGFPAELWIRCLYDALVAFHRPGIDRERLLAALTPLYFARTAGFITETAEMTTDQAERVIEAQALAFEGLKPYLVKRWTEMQTARGGG